MAGLAFKRDQNRRAAMRNIANAEIERLVKVVVRECAVPPCYTISIRNDKSLVERNKTGTRFALRMTFL